MIDNKVQPGGGTDATFQATLLIFIFYGFHQSKKNV